MPLNNKNVVLFLGAGFSKSIDNKLPCGTKLLKKILTSLDVNTRKTINHLLSGIDLDQNANTIQPFELLLSIVQRLKCHQLAGRPALIGIDAEKLWQKLIKEVSNVTYFKHRDYSHYDDQSTSLGKFIRFLREKSKEASISIVTTNYDLIADKAAQYINDEHLGHPHDMNPPRDLQRYQYGYPIRNIWPSDKGDHLLVQGYIPRTSLKSKGIPVYKLHGSTNWAYCKSCKKLDLSRTREELGKIFQRLAICSQCGSTYEWLIIPPVPNKSIANPIFKKVWRAAEKVLEKADWVIFAGYSFPPADPVVLEMVFTARLRSKHLHGEPWRYKVFDPDKEVCKRYKNIFGGKAQKEQEFKIEMLDEFWQSTVMKEKR